MILCQFQGTVRAMDPLSLANYSKDKYYAEIGHILRRAINTAVPESVLMNIHGELVDQVTKYIQHHLKRLCCMSLNGTSVNQMPTSLEEHPTTDDSNTNTNRDVFITRVENPIAEPDVWVSGTEPPKVFHEQLSVGKTGIPMPKSAGSIMDCASTHATLIKQNEFLMEQNQYLQSQFSDLFDMYRLTHDLVKDMAQKIQELSSYQNKSNTYSEKKQNKSRSKSTGRRKTHFRSDVNTDNDTSLREFAVQNNNMQTTFHMPNVTPHRQRETSRPMVATKRAATPMLKMPQKPAGPDFNVPPPNTWRKKKAPSTRRRIDFQHNDIPNRNRRNTNKIRTKQDVTFREVKLDPTVSPFFPKSYAPVHSMNYQPDQATLHSHNIGPYGINNHRCFFCGEPGHTSEICGHGRPINCYKCNRKGHKSHHCPY